MPQKMADIELRVCIALWVSIVLYLPEEGKKAFTKLKGIWDRKIVRIFSLNNKEIVILVFSDKTRNFTAEMSMFDIKVISLRQSRYLS